MNMYSAYEAYFSSNAYDQRYSRPNPFTLERLLNRLRPGTTVLDIGAGNGRYAIPLARHGVDVLAIERSEAARGQLLARLQRSGGLTGRVRTYVDLAEVPGDLVGEAVAALFLFGVLAHMSLPTRGDILNELASKMPDDSCVIGSVPNRIRRFRRQQRSHRVACGSPIPRFRYVRTIQGRVEQFEYSAYSPDQLVSEFEGYGWNVAEIRPEAIFSERIATSDRLAGRIDKRLVQVLPASLGYCLYFEARKV